MILLKLLNINHDTAASNTAKINKYSWLFNYAVSIDII
jgi:hypothetical protein